MTTTTTPALYVKEIAYDRESRDFAMTLDGQLVGYARTYYEAEVALDNLVHELVMREAAQDEAALCCENCSAELAAEDGIEADGLMACDECYDGFAPAELAPALDEAAQAEALALAEQLVGELNQIDGQQVAAAAAGQTELAMRLVYAYDDTSDRIRALGYDIGPSDPAGCIGESPLCLYDAVTQQPLGRVEAAA
jgi:hypothetical protein